MAAGKRFLVKTRGARRAHFAPVDETLSEKISRLPTI
jgi:hypothetical protein